MTVLSLLIDSFQRHQIPRKTRQFVVRELALKRGHGRLIQDREFLEIGPLERQHSFFPVEYLHREAVLIQQAPVDGLALLRHYPYDPVLRQNLRVRVDNRFLDLRRPPSRSDVTEIRTESGSVPLYPVAAGAVALAFKNGLAAFCVADLHRR